MYENKNISKLTSAALSLCLLLGPNCLNCSSQEQLQEPSGLEGIGAENKTAYNTIDIASLDTEEPPISKLIDQSTEKSINSNYEEKSPDKQTNDNLISAQSNNTPSEEINTNRQLAQNAQDIDLKPPIVDTSDPKNEKWSSPDLNDKTVKLTATASNQYEQINSLSNRILRKEVELLKLNTEFRINTTKQSKWKRWRTFGFNMAASSVSFAGITTVAAENWRTHHNFKRGTRETFIAGPLLLLIGHSIVLGGVVVESTLDKMKEYKDWKNGISPGHMTNKVLVLQNEIDKLIKERETQLAQYENPSNLQKRFMSAEGKVLRDVRDLALVEYAQFYVRARKRAVSRDVSYLNSSAIAATGGFQGSLNGMLSVINKRRMQALPAGLGFLESGALIVIAPWLNRGVAAITGKAAQKKINKQLGDLGTTTIKQLSSHLKELKTATAQLPNELKPRQMTHRIDLYDDGQGVFEQQALFNSIEKAKGQKEFWEKVIANASIGGTKMAWGINLAYAGAAFPTGGGHKLEQFRRIVANGSTAFVVGTSIWMLDTIQARTRGEIDLHSMGTQQATPIHKLNKRLDVLNKLEEKLKI